MTACVVDSDETGVAHSVIEANADFESLRMRCVGCAVWTNVIVAMLILSEEVRL